MKEEEAKKKKIETAQEEDEEEKHVEVEETAGAAEKSKMGHVLLRKGVGSEMKKDGEGGLGSIPASADGAPPPPVSPPVHLRSSPALPSRGQANLLFQSSCFNVLVALSPPSLSLFVSLTLSLSLSLFLSHPSPPLPPRGGSACRPHSGPREWAPMFHSPRQQNEPPRRQLIFQEATSASAVTYTRDIHSHTYATASVVRAFIDFADRRGSKFSDGDRQESLARAFYECLRSLISEATGSSGQTFLLLSLFTLAADRASVSRSSLY